MTEHITQTQHSAKILGEGGNIQIQKKIKMPAVVKRLNNLLSQAEAIWRLQYLALTDGFSLLFIQYVLFLKCHRCEAQNRNTPLLPNIFITACKYGTLPITQSALLLFC